MNPSETKELLDDAKLGALLQRSPWWVAEQAKARRFPHVKVGRSRRYTPEHVEQIFKLLEQPAVDPLARSPRSRKGRAA